MNCISLVIVERFRKYVRIDAYIRLFVFIYVYTRLYLPIYTRLYGQNILGGKPEGRSSQVQFEPAVCQNCYGYV